MPFINKRDEMKIFQILFLLVNSICFSQNINVTPLHTYLDTLENKTLILSIYCEVDGLDFNDNKRIRLTHVQGEDINNNTLNIDDFYNFRYNDNMIHQNKFTIDFVSKNKFSKIKNIRGSFRYFTPTIENGGKRIIENPLENNCSQLFKDQKKIKGCILDLEKLSFLKQNNKKQFKLEVRKIISTNNFNKTAFYSSLKWYFKEYKILKENFKQSFALYLEDPTNQFVGTQTIDEENRIDKMTSRANNDFNKLIIINYHQKATTTWKIILEIETDASVTDYNFSLHDIEIPEKNYYD